MFLRFIVVSPLLGLEYLGRALSLKVRSYLKMGESSRISIPSTDLLPLGASDA
jgi:hypothetical protein